MKRRYLFVFVPMMILIAFHQTEAKEKASSHVNLGVSNYKLGKYDDAVKQFQKALAIEPDFPNIQGPDPWYIWSLHEMYNV